MASILEQYRIADFLEWDREKKLTLNPDFQRGNVWTPAARTYLIDTILRGFPIPKIYLRTTIDATTKKSLRDVVDGQQRLRAIIDFANDKFALSKRAGELAGTTFSTLTDELKQRFLEYPIAVDQLLNARTEDVLEVFARLNSYGVQLNAAEKRHAKFQGEFKWSVRASSKKWSILWQQCQILGVRERVRMLDDSLIAEMYGILLLGVQDGGQRNIDKLYTDYDTKFQPDQGIPEKLDRVLAYFMENLATDLGNTSSIAAPHFLMLFAALAQAIVRIPNDADKFPEFPPVDSNALHDLNIVRDNLRQIASIIEASVPPPRYEDFWRAAKSSTHRLSSRKIRFPIYYRALSPIAL
jgi:hypothetical protein